MESLGSIISMHLWGVLTKLHMVTKFSMVNWSDSVFCLYKDKKNRWCCMTSSKQPSILLNTNSICFGSVKECQHRHSRKKNIEEDEKYYKGWLRLRESNWDRLWIVHKERSQVVTKKVQRWVKYEGVMV